MKINKLFHWLYACLMFLPILVFVPSILFYAFNKDAKVPEVVDIQYNYKYETNEVNNVNDFKEGNIYKFNFDDITDINSDDTLDFEIKIIDGSINTYYGDSPYADDGFFTFSKNYNLYLYLERQSTTINLIDTVSSSSIYFEDIVSYEISNCTFLLVNKYDIVATDITDYFVASDYNEVESIDVIEDQTPSISTVVSKAWDDTWHNALFSWSYDSFLTAPFLYITGLFGVPSNSTLNFTFSYWLSISIIWLVFDLVMYVPLLVHRWIDKAGID